MYNRKLVLENGTVFEGIGFGSMSDIKGEIVFTTGMTGYQESITDPSFYQQLLVFTYPMIGNYGINSNDYESLMHGASGVIVELSKAITLGANTIIK
jgi:carbamoyl-phosphate synthase small subunit